LDVRLFVEQFEHEIRKRIATDLYSALKDQTKRSESIANGFFELVL